jgi:hypothetical protein
MRGRKEILMGWKIEMAIFFNFIFFHSIFCQTNMDVYGSMGERGLFHRQYDSVDMRHTQATPLTPSAP